MALQKSTPYKPEMLNKTFHAKLHESERYVRQFVRRTKLTQSQFDSLVSFVYNVGVGGAARALTLADEGKNLEVASEMSRYIHVRTLSKKTGKAHYVKSTGLIKRRIRECQPFIETAGSIKE